MTHGNLWNVNGRIGDKWNNIKDIKNAILIMSHMLKLLMVYQNQFELQNDRKDCSLSPVLFNIHLEEIWILTMLIVKLYEGGLKSSLHGLHKTWDKWLLGRESDRSWCHCHSSIKKAFLVTSLSSMGIDA